MKFSEHLEGAEPEQDIVNEGTIDKDSFDELELPAFARNRGVTTTTRMSDKEFDPEDLEVPAYKRTSDDKGKDIESKGRSFSQQFKKPLAPGEQSKWDIERKKRSDWAKRGERYDLGHDPLDIVHDEDPDHEFAHKKHTLADLERIVRRIKNRNK